MALENNLLSTKPLLARQWHLSKNKPFRPEDVTSGSNKKVWWRCPKGHEWQASIVNRSKGRGCPYCSGKLPTPDTCLEKVNPVIAGQWHPSKNAGLTPKDVTSGSSKKVWWLCKSGHEWQATINNRTKGNGCPDCSGRRRYRY